LILSASDRLFNFRGKVLNKSSLVKLIGFPSTLIHGDTLVLDRWLWLCRLLPVTKNKETLLDVGCGTGAFSIGAALRGYESLGLSWDARNQKTATDRAELCGAKTAHFDVLDVRGLGSRADLKEMFDVVICCENIEHIVDDRKLINDIAACLKPGGRLLLTTPYILYRSIGDSDMGPFLLLEDGRHVRRGYSKAMLRELCCCANLELENISYCSGFFSQKITFVLRSFSKIHPLLGWTATLPLRLLPPVFDRLIASYFGWPDFSICLEAYKPRYAQK
jgi:2-polyprenyl-3-methyl-5-hydroxy-6-metoxy-1,4-benzoquinol methylase